MQPGANEITVIGLTPTVDEQSIKVEGTGSAIITDITVELLPNRDIFQEIYPDSDSDSDKDESEEDADDEDKVNPALDEVREKLIALIDEQNRAEEVVASAESRLAILDAYSKSLDRKRGVDIEASMETYRSEREKVYKDQMEGAVRGRQLGKEITKLRREERRLERLEQKEEERAAKAKEKVRRAKEKVKEKQRRRDAEKQKEKTRIRKERENFWPKSCYSVRITLDAAVFTPGSSRRNSIASATDVKVVADKEPAAQKAEELNSTCDLTLSYVTSSAFWSPSYDLSLSTTTNTAMLCFDAQLTNMTSETWSNSKVTLSTSQANFSGLQDDIPSLVPWRLKVVGRGGPWDGHDIAHSREERAEKEVWNAAQNNVGQQKPRSTLFGVSQEPQQQQLMYAQRAQQMAQQNAQQQAALQARQAQMAIMPFQSAPIQAPQAPGSIMPQMASSGGFAQSLAAAAPRKIPSSYSPPLYSATNTQTPGANHSTEQEEAKLARKSTRAFASLPTSKTIRMNMNSVETRSGPGSNAPLPAYDYGSSEAEEEEQTILEPTPEVTFQDSSFEETGLTATYDLPHLKTLKPSSTASKQRVARISFANLLFTRTVVAKYKPAAHLRARLRNTSKLTLLRGPTGLTLDGTFLGRATLPRCSAGDTFSVPLGIDPAIRVAYPKPDVTRSTTGVFSKGENSVYLRSITLVNTRASAGKPVAITVLDQVPVSEDEKIRVDVLHPAGMAVGGRAVATGVPGKEGREEAEWGRATANLRKAGEVAWEVSLNAGRSVKLMLQYEVAFPTGERVAQVY